ncbi:hypothetical protein A3D85_00070 [Candidatus Amesbacteria bacterium RIFCSPHIGHO2_02_FULL_47_9]|uniref:SGNH hydrolase-type esterase domain-containing protein n=1 Tax=Candidatus Amesbacteria bacterium RIFCSPHIGHO2_01_FULL_48_32b TaxID=1797253 RepID=A0A1F4YGM7_9BACT|nr:MAG: hypothetical protein A2876_00855 [Candidatus Amesbacteria bacterium RIFCSPHIGHO2_01_FULL_48_32b]OGD03183.1 MAG: hypothetical protein A3D85_00070 [Candidatus Amesbacteria bacterium RIFCSPHIGHO2_02_FULL_47_9]OGD07434.1 MAG: hypothetical protein A2899_03980 [Candidatus Amesbacteria bacterium RIFCSPLOWO2_01_FULL_49_25]
MNPIRDLKITIESGQQYKIFFIGDSITSAEWVHPNWREIFEYALKQELESQYTDWKIPSWGIRCFNYGFDGSTTGDIKNLQAKGLIPSDPNLVVYVAGDNDRFDKFSVNEYQTNIQKVVSSFPNSYIALSSDLCPGNNYISSKYESGYYQTLFQIKIPNGQLIDLFAETKQFDLKKFYTFVSSGNEVAGLKAGDVDFYHPNQLGNAYIVKIFLKSIFNIDFDFEKYTSTNLQGLMYPEYK